MKMLRLCLCCFLTCLLAPGVHAQQRLTWEDITGPPGFATLVPAGGDSVFATNGRGVVYVSSDQGLHWGGILGYPSRSPITDIAASGQILAVALTDVDVTRGRYKVLLWNQSPNSWRTIYSDNDANFSNLIVDPSGILYGIQFGVLGRYRNGGWALITNNLPFPTFTGFGEPLHNTVMAADDGALYVGVDTTDPSGTGGVYVSSDSGATWRQYLQNYAVTAMAGSLGDVFDVGSNQGVLETTDGGSSWRGLGLSGRIITRLLRVPGGALFALADGSVWRRDPVNGSWSMLTENVQPLTSIVSFSTQSFFASSEAAGAFRSVDGGVLWGGGELRGKDVFSIAVTDSGEVLSGTLGNGIYRSLFGQSAWLRAVLDSSASEIFSFARSGGMLFAGTNQGVALSSDQGLTWRIVSSDAFVGSAYALGTLGDGTILAGTNTGVFRSSDGGAHWSPSGLAASKVYFMDISPSNVVLVATATDGVALSTDGGGTWTKKGLVRDDLQCVLAPASGSLAVGVYGGIFRSIDNGATWTYRQFTRSYNYALVAGDSGRIYAGTATSVFVSPDDGISWQAAGDSGLTQKAVLSLCRMPSGKLLAGTYRGGAYRSFQQPAFAFPDGVGPVTHLPGGFALAQNYPNPFNPLTDISYSLERAATVRLRIVNLLGQTVETLVDERQQPGSHRVRWNADGHPTGIYFYTLEAGNERSTRKMVYLR